MEKLLIRFVVESASAWGFRPHIPRVDCLMSRRQAVVQQELVRPRASSTSAVRIETVHADRTVCQAGTDGETS